MPFVGNALSFLFGVASDDDLGGIRRAIKTLDLNQQKIQHVVKKSLSFLKVSHSQVVQNRQRINKLNEGIRKLFEVMNDYSQTFNQKVDRIELFLNYFMQVQSIVDNTKEIMLEILNYMEDLHLQINLLSMGKLSSNTVNPSKLYAILQKVKSNLPEGLRLPANPDIDL